MSLRVVRPGLLSLLVDAGRPRTRALGVPVGGAADRAALAVGNALVGNAPDAPAVEVALAGPTLVAEHPAAAVVFGAPFAVAVNGAAIAPGTTFTLEAGDTLAIGPTPTGARGYLCVAGGFDGPVVLGSRSALDPLKAGDILACGASRCEPRGLGFAALAGAIVAVRAGRSPEPPNPPGPPYPGGKGGDAPPHLPGAPSTETASQEAPQRGHPSPLRGGAGGEVNHASPPASLACSPSTILRALPGPQFDWFADDRFFRAGYTVTPASNRMGVRLAGEALARRPGELVSEAVGPGAVQVANDGLPIVLGVDGQTIGGYPKVAHVIRADLDRLAQLRPGDRVRFARVTAAEAETAARERAAVVRFWLTRLRAADRCPSRVRSGE